LQMVFFANSLRLCVFAVGVEEFFTRSETRCSVDPRHHTPTDRAKSATMQIAPQPSPREDRRGDIVNCAKCRMGSVGQTAHLAVTGGHTVDDQAHALH
jgi:hypothetical protein